MNNWDLALKAIGWFVIFYCLILLLTATGCVHPAKSVCVVEAVEGTCWVAKSEGLGRPLREMEGEFCMSAQDNARLLRRLNECQNTNLPVVGRTFSSLCVIESEYEMCWVDKKGGAGRSFPEMEGNFCMDRPDMERILRRLNECANRREAQGVLWPGSPDTE